ncbi:hypothetical protein AB5N19_07625 [Seiridium cardinale]|uniref:Uncharacterized protein n=1 Tax=Seiridium cardinale TaxID=138064 RepID=A0ABR2XT98_9PEZI
MASVHVFTDTTQFPSHYRPQQRLQREPPFRTSQLSQQLLPDAKYTRINRWRSEIDPADVVCSCSEHMESVAKPAPHRRKSSSSAAGDLCAACGRPGESLEQRRKRSGLASALSSSTTAGAALATARTSSFIRKFFSKRAVQDRGGGGGADSSSGGGGPGGGGGGRVSTTSSSPRRPKPGDGATQMYRQDEADDEASGSSPDGGLSDSADGKGRPKLGVDDTAARLRRAQKLLNAQGKGKG